MRSERERLVDILEAISRIEKYAIRGKTAFIQDELKRNVEVILSNLDETSP